MDISQLEELLLTSLHQIIDSLASLNSSHSSVTASAQRPRNYHGSKSFSRLEASTSSPLTRSRAPTLDTEAFPVVDSSEPIGDFLEAGPGTRQDAFENTEVEDDLETEAAQDHGVEASPALPEGFDELPIELISLTDRFIESLSAKVHSSPPSIEKLASHFQDFYALAASHISTHISTLSSRLHRDSSPAKSTSSRSASATKLLTRVGSASSKDEVQSSPDRQGSEQQMLTAREISERRNARRLLEKKRVALEEAVERRVCERIYHKIWRHRSTQDEERDEKLRSRTAALAVVGIGLMELGILPDLSEDKQALAVEKFQIWLADAREGLTKMNDEKYPLGKLMHLKMAHKSIVDTLSRLHPSSSSADEILPTLIYTLITTPTEGVNIISNLCFIQRFRSENKIDGEAAYCLTNLEAAISFLETVDLASLKADEAPSGPPMNKSQPLRPTDPSPLPSQAELTPNVLQSQDLDIPAKHLPSAAQPQPPSSTPPAHQRRISQLLQPSTDAFGAASDAVINTADQSFKTIGNTLESSYKFLFGRLKEREVGGDGVGEDGKVVVPKTLDDARKLVSSPFAAANDDDDVLGDPEVVAPTPKVDEKLLGLFGGRLMSRQRSTDSVKSGGSGGGKIGGTKSPVQGDASSGFRPRASSDARKSGVSAPPSTPNPAPFLNPAAESMRNLGNTLNPLNRLAGINVMRFGRSNTASPVPPTSAPASNGEGYRGQSLPDLPVASTSGADSTTKTTVPVSPPIRKFLELDNPGELRISEVLELLRDYRRLAGALKDLGAL
ncbi:MAG: hypothetical protein M1833_001937 [Piccolia ochrophora]|nr:MAG: hypothetical protein M1833_001937 [Piccolia ochrophora]